MKEIMRDFLWEVKMNSSDQLREMHLAWQNQYTVFKCLSDRREVTHSDFFSRHTKTYIETETNFEVKMTEMQMFLGSGVRKRKSRREHERVTEERVRETKREGY